MTKPSHAVTHYYVEPGAIEADLCRLSAEESKHLVKVMRAQAGDEIKVTDGVGNLHTVKLESLSEKQASGKIVYSSARVNEPDYEIAVAFGLLTGAKTEQVIDQCTQLGVTSIQPLLSKSVTVRWKGGRGENKLERWQRVAIAALKQSCGTILPELQQPIKLDSCIKSFKRYDLVLLATPMGNPISSLSVAGSLKRILVLSGPEEGFTGPEEAALIAAGALPIRLGPRRLRAELAPVVMISSLLAQLD